MKRIGNLYDEICSIENLELADKKARKNKSKQYGIKEHDKNREQNILDLHTVLLSGEFKNSLYRYKIIEEPKERQIAILPYYPDRIVHHAIVNVMRPIWLSTMTANTYSCIPGKGIHRASFDLRKALRNVNETTYCLKLDAKKFYHNVKHEILRGILRKKIKDQKLLDLLDEIIQSHSGIPIGNYLSQYFANLYLNPLDHYLKEVLKVKYYFRYMDDIIILSDSKEYLHGILGQIRFYLNGQLGLKIKENYQVFPVAKRGIDFVGYVHFHTHVLLRTSIKRRYIKFLWKGTLTLAAYNGWLKHCGSINLRRKYELAA